MTTTLFIQILNMSLGAAWAALLVILARPLLRRFSHCCCYALWGVVLFRLVCPVSFSSVLSLMPRPQAIPQEIIFAQTPQVESGFALFDQAVNQTLSSVPATPPSPAAPQISVNPVEFWLGAGNLVWQVGMALLLLYGLASCLYFLRKLRGAVLVKDNIWESDRVPTAFVLGIFRPRVYLPTGLKEDEMSFVLCHEQTHIRRLDHIIKPVSLLLLTVHWFNPVLWLAWFMMRRDMEMSCDELALKKLGEENRKGYSACLLNLSARQSGLAAPLAFGESNVRGRIVNILRYKKPALWGTVLTVVLACVLGFCLLSNPSENSRTALPDPNPGEGSSITLANSDGGSFQEEETPPSQGDIPDGSAPGSGQNANGLVSYRAPVRNGATSQGSEALLGTANYIGASEVQYYIAKGTPVYSPISGTVDAIQANIVWPYGRWISVRSAENSDVTILLSHLSAVEEGLAVGDPVDTATQLGLSGSTGNTAYPAVGVTVRVEEDSVTYDLTRGTETLYELWDLTIENFPDCLSLYPDGDAAGDEIEVDDPNNYFYYDSRPNRENDPSDDSGEEIAPIPFVRYTRPVRMEDVRRAAVMAEKLDLLVERGTPVYSPISGTVDRIDDWSVWPFGKKVVIRSSENPDIQVMVVHLSSVEEGLTVGDTVDDAAQLGLSGATGNTSYPAVGVVVQQRTDGVFSSIKISQWADVLVNSFAEEAVEP